MSKVGGKTTKFYRETRGIKVTGGQKVTTGVVLTRQGDRWKPGLNVLGQMHLTAACDGEVYFSRKRGTAKKEQTYINIKPFEQETVKKEKKATKTVKAEACSVILK